MMQRNRLLAVFSLIVSVAVCLPAHAQSTTGSMLGVVRDPSGAVIGGAEITATNTQTAFERTTQTDATGAYLLTNLPIGQYQLRVVSSGFKTFVQTGITLVVDQNARVDATLPSG